MAGSNELCAMDVITEICKKEHIRGNASILKQLLEEFCNTPVVGMVQNSDVQSIGGGDFDISVIDDPRDGYIAITEDLTFYEFDGTAWTLKFAGLSDFIASASNNGDDTYTFTSFDGSTNFTIAIPILSVEAGPGIDVDVSDPKRPSVGLDQTSQDSLAKADSAVQPGDLAPVATSGDYDDLLNKPTLTPQEIVFGGPSGEHAQQDGFEWDGDRLTFPPIATIRIGYQTDPTLSGQSLFVGYGAGNGSSNNPQSTMLGYQAGWHGAGSQTVFIGYRAAFDNTGGGSTAIGSEALRSNSGVWSIGIGPQALQNNTGNYGTAIGRQALYGNTGMNAIAIGYTAGSGNTHGNVIIIGNNQSATKPNQVKIGDAYQDWYVEGDIGIHTDSPGQGLDVNSSMRLREHLYDANNLDGTGLNNPYLSTVAGGIEWKEMPNFFKALESYSFGVNLQTFLSKARDYKFGRFGAKAPKVVLIGDSIFGGSWVNGFASYLNSEFNIPLENIENHWYGGCSVNYMIPFLENIAIFSNPDLVIFGEYENAGLNDELFARTEWFIKTLRENTTADIAITTWSMQRAAADILWNGGIPDKSLIQNDPDYTDFHVLRNLAIKYNCELIDHNEAIVQYILNGNDPANFYSSGPHLTTSGYNQILLPEILKHFPTTLEQRYFYNANVLNKEEIIYAADSLFNEYFTGSKLVFGDPSKWSDKYGSKLIDCETPGETLEFNINDGIGFEVITVDRSGSMQCEIMPSGGVYQAPSTMTFNGNVLQYGTEIISITYANSWDKWRLKRPFKKPVVNTNVLPDQVFESGQYKIEVIDIGAIVQVDTGSNWVEVHADVRSGISVSDTLNINGSTGNDGAYTVSTIDYNIGGSGNTRISFTESISDSTVDGYLLLGDNKQLVTCNILDPSDAILDTFMVGFESASILGGDVTFPLNYNNQHNYKLSSATLDNWGQPANSNFDVGDQYEFYLRSNWVDNLDLNLTHQGVFGLERGDYAVKLTLNSASAIRLFAIKILK